MSEIFNIEEINDLTQLEEMKTQIENRISKLRKLEISEARKQIQEMADRLGVDVSDLVPQLNKLAAKYVNPKDTTQTWSGRGKRPVWLNNALQKGAKLEDFKV